jgi:hypothetical protein
MVRFSYAHIPAYPLDESIRLIKIADELGCLRRLCVRRGAS